MPATRSSRNSEKCWPPTAPGVLKWSGKMLFAVGLSVFIGLFVDLLMKDHKDHIDATLFHTENHKANVQFSDLAASFSACFIMFVFDRIVEYCVNQIVKCQKRNDGTRLVERGERRSDDEGITFFSQPLNLIKERTSAKILRVLTQFVLAVSIAMGIGFVFDVTIKDNFDGTFTTPKKEPNIELSDFVSTISAALIFQTLELLFKKYKCFENLIDKAIGPIKDDYRAAVARHSRRMQASA